MIDDKGLSLLYGEITGESSEKNESRNKTVKLANVATPRNEKVLPIDVPELSFIGLDDIEAHTMKQLGSKVASGLKSSAKRFYKGDLLYSRLRPYLNKVWRSNKDGICSSEFIVIPENENIDTRFLAYRLNATDFVAFANSLNAGDRPRVDFKQISLFEIPAFSLSQQQEVVVKIEELFSELDSGIASLKTARDQLKIYRQALLKHAFEGKLTAQWRKDNADKLETPEQLLARIQTERETRYQQQLEEWKQAVKDWEAKGKEGKKPTKPNKIIKAEKLSESDLANVPSLPASWFWLKVGMLCDVVRGGSPRPAGDSRFYDGEIPFLKVADLTRVTGLYVNSAAYTIKPAGLQKTRAVSPNTLLISNSGATLGVPKICTIYATFNDGVAAFLRLGEEELKYHYYFWESKTAELRAINQGAAQPNLNTDLIKDTLFPSCSLAEQQEIVNQLEEKLSIIEQNEKEIESALAKAELLRQSILKKAFSGRLIYKESNS